MTCEICGGTGGVETVDPATGHPTRMPCPGCNGTGKAI